MSASMSRKRDRPAVAYASATHDTSNITYRSFYLSPNDKIGGLVSASAVTVSPFFKRTPGATASDISLITSSSPLLSPVPVGPDHSFDQSQSSNTSTLTFDCNNAASDSNCSMEKSGEGSNGAVASWGNAMKGNMFRSAIDSVVDCRQCTTYSRSLVVNDIEVGMQFSKFDECPCPPIKRSRLDCGLHILSRSSHNHASSSSSSELMIKSSGAKKMVASTNCCCHVCFLGASASNGKNSIFAPTSSSDLSSVVPDRHSLLAYFQPTKQKTPPISQQQHQSTKSHYTLQSSFSSLNLQYCRYCDKPTCLTCMRQCEQCLHRFCLFCTKVDYESNIVERILCFECDEHLGRETHERSFVRSRHEKEHCCMMDI
jgi:hypothetical protein